GPAHAAGEARSHGLRVPLPGARRGAAAPARPV
ncbi:MAG: hypothetical protein AVDCRST_MAG12-711, partial [uncultured Rubrobacteraceae bacterium]